MNTYQLHDDQQLENDSVGEEGRAAASSGRKPIAVGAEDYCWNPQGPTGIPPPQVGGRNRTVSNSISSSNFSLSRLSLRESSTPSASTATTTSSQEAARAQSANPKASKKKIRQDDDLVAMMHHSHSLHSKRAEKQKQREARMEKDAAKAAAAYYGECYLEGVGMSHADKAARESHAGYKKWWLQEFHGSSTAASLGDAYNLPIFRSPSKPPPKQTLPNGYPSGGYDYSHNVPSGETAKYVAVDDYDNQTPRLTSKEIGGAAKITATATHDLVDNGSYRAIYAERHMLDRSSGARNPFPTQDEIDLALEEKKQTKKRQRSFNSSFGTNSKGSSSNFAAPHSKPISILKNSTFSIPEKQEQLPLEPTYSSCYSSAHGIDPNATTDDEAYTNPKPRMKPINSKPRLSYERNKMRFQRRTSSSIEYDSDVGSMYHSQSSAFYHDVHERKEGKEDSTHRVHDQGRSYKNGDSEKYDAILTSVAPPMKRTAKHIDNAKLELIRALAVSAGDVTNTNFLFALEQLRTLYSMTGNDARLAHETSKTNLEGNWLTISRPHFSECLGTNSGGEFMYTLGRLSFDMFAPGQLICSIGGIFNRIEMVNPQENKLALRSIPKALNKEVQGGKSILRRYE